MTLKDLLAEDYSRGESRRGRYTADGPTLPSSGKDWRQWGWDQGKALLPLWGGGTGTGYWWFAPEIEYDQAVEAWLEGWAEGIREAVEGL